MAEYPIGVPLPPSSRFTGNPPASVVMGWRNQIKDYLNEQAKTVPEVTLSSGQIARGAGVSKEDVEVFLRKMPHASRDSITIFNRQLENNHQV